MFDFFMIAPKVVKRLAPSRLVQADKISVRCLTERLPGRAVDTQAAARCDAMLNVRARESTAALTKYVKPRPSSSGVERVMSLKTLGRVILCILVYLAMF